ncbi:MLX-interacting protein [Caloenas nicobarica]
MAADVFMRPARLLGAAGPLSPRTEPDEDSSDTDDGGASPGGGRRCGPRRGQPPGPQIIHSGHFMVSSPHSEHPPKKGYDFDTVNEQTCQTYQFGAARGGGGAGGRLSIDASLTKLFECMSLAYSGKLVSPKWKNFKGLKLQWRDKIRLNNAIWRAWYMQYLEKRKNPVCHFVTPLDGSVDVEEHRRPEAIATEGKYWKRRIEIVIREYHKWRTYFKKRLQKHKDEDLSSLVRDDDVVLWQKRRYGRETPVPMEEGSLLDADMLMSEFTDTLFSTLSSHQLVSWPNSRDIGHLGNADMIQPGLIPLQPNFDFMDTFEPFQDLFTPSRSNSYFPSVSAVSSGTTDSSSHSSQSPVLPSGSLPSTLPAGTLGDGLIASSVPAPVIPDVGTDQCSSIRSGESFIQPPDFTPDSSSLSGPQTFMPVFQAPLPLLQPATQQHPAPLPAVPLNSNLSSSPAAFAAPEAQKSGLCESTVITHTASATLTHNAPATTFSQSQNYVLATQHPGAGVPCNLAFQTAVLQGQPRPQLQSQLTFALPKAVPLASAGTRPKQSQKRVPAPKPETVSLLVKNAFITPAAFQGQSRAVIVTPAPLKREGILTPATSQSNVAIAPPGIVRAPRVTEFRSNILVGPAQRAPSSQQTQSTVSHLFSPSVVQDVLVKGEQISSHSSSSQVPSPTPSRDCQNSGQASPCTSEQSPSPQSPQNSCSGKLATDPSMTAFKNRQKKHISEQKRRFNIKIGFDTLNNLVSPSSKLISHAITLQKTVEHITKLQQERAQMQEETRRLREEIEELNATIISCQQQLPATGVLITRQKFDHLSSMFDEYVRSRTLQNWKFWIFSIIIKPLFESFNWMVSTSSFKDLNQTAMAWLDQHCSLPALRPMVLNTLRDLSKTTSILSDPSRLPEQAAEAVNTMNTTDGDT